jgi:flagellar hook assembly protein FlgD
LRRFQVVAEPKQGPGLQITDLRAEPGKGAGLQVQFTLNQAAETTVAVRSLNGREVAQVESRKSRSTGLNTVAWDRRDSQGRPLPPGVYLLEVQAMDGEGQQVKAVRSVALR